MILLANIGAKGLYLMFIWLLSAATAAWVAERKGYGERVGLTFGLVLTVVGLVIVLLLPGRPGSAWRVEGWLPESWWDHWWMFGLARWRHRRRTAASKP